MKKVINHQSVELICGFLSKSMYNKMTVADRTVVLVTLRMLKEKKLEFDKTMAELGKTLMPEGYDDRRKAAMDMEKEYAESFGRIDSQERMAQFTDELKEQHPEYGDFLKERDNYISECNKALSEHAQETVELNIQQLSDKGYNDLLSSNNWNFEQAELMHTFFMKED